MGWLLPYNHCMYLHIWVDYLRWGNYCITVKHTSISGWTISRLSVQSCDRPTNRDHLPTYKPCWEVESSQWVTSLWVICNTHFPKTHNFYSETLKNNLGWEKVMKQFYVLICTNVRIKWQHVPIRCLRHVWNLWPKKLKMEKQENKLVQRYAPVLTTSV